MIEKIVKEYEALGIKFYVTTEEGEKKLKFRGPKGIMTRERINSLQEVRQELIRFIEEDEKKGILIQDGGNRFEVFPLTDIQAAYLVGRNPAYELGGVGCHGYVELTMPIMDEKRLEKAFHKVINRHEMMRAVVFQNGVQKVLENVKMPKLGFQDLRGMENEKVETAVNRVREELENKTYNPEKWPLYDFVLSTLDDKSILHCSIDMLIADFVSVDLILKELDYYYYNEGSELKELTISYRDLIVNQKQKEKTLSGMKAKEKDWDYWKDKIETLPGKPELPIINGTNVLPNKFEKYRFELLKEKWDAICGEAQTQNLTPSSIVLSVFSDAIRMFSKNDRFCINLTQLKRPYVHPQVNDIVGDFTAVEVLEINTNGKFLERTHQLQKRLWDDLEHGAVSGIEVLREAGRVQNTNMIIPVVYTSTLGLYNDNGTAGEFMRDAKITYRISQTPQVWIDCQVSEYKGGLEINWDVRSGVFPDGFINDVFTVFKNALEKIALDKNSWNKKSVCELDKNMLATRLLANDTEKVIDTSGSLQNGFWNHVVSTPKKIALICNDEKYTYKELSNYVFILMNELQEKNCKAGDVVVVLQEKGIWQIASVIAVLSIDATYLPVDCNQPKERISLIIKDAEAKCIITDSREKIVDGDCIIEVNNLIIHSLLVTRIPDNTAKYPAYIIYTSGTTGVPKGVVMSHKAALNTILDINEKFSIDETDRILSLANLAFDLSVYDIFGIFTAGGTLVLPSSGKEKDPQDWLYLVEKYHITTWNTVPPMMQLLVTYMNSVENLVIESMKTVLLSGDWIPVSLPKTIIQYFPNAKVISLGGATEGGIWSIYYLIDNINIKSNSVPYGKPLANQRFYILNRDMEDSPNMVTGKLYIAGDSLADGYYKDEELTAKKFRRHPVTGEIIYDTGDLGRYLLDGNIEFQGRNDNQIKIRGHRIELSEIEGILNNYTGVQNAIALKTAKNKIAAFIESQNRKEPDNAESFRSVVEKSYMAGDNSLKNVNRDLFKRWVELSDKTTLYEIMTVFHTAGFFRDNVKLHSEEEIRNELKVLPKYNRLLKRWLNVLCSQDYIEYLIEEKKYRRKIKEFHEEDTKLYREEFEKTENKLQYGKELYNYMKESSKYITELLQGTVDPLALFFPEGRTDIAMAAYNDNIINHALNNVVRAGLKQLISTYGNHKEGNGNKVRILEIGAGVGGTTTDILPELVGFNIEYRFTDVSSFFINEAKKKFSKYPFVSYGLFDINQNYFEQGLVANSWDIIISANVLHNSKNAPEVLAKLKELLKPDGALIVIEATRESFSLLTSLEFKEGLTGFTDSRKGTDRTFFNREQWNEMFEAIGAEVLCTYPRSEDPISAGGQSVFITKVHSHKERLNYEDIDEYLRNKLPSYMVPDRVEILSEFPMNNNGKIDRNKLLDRILENKQEISVESKFNNKLEEEIAEIWKEVLNVTQVGRSENFYVAGGDSLLIAQVVTKIHEKIEISSNIKWDVLMRLMLQNMTIAEFSEALMRESNGTNTVSMNKKVENTKALVTFKEAINKKENAKVLFHAGTGTLTPYNKLLGRLLETSDKNEGILGFCFGDEQIYLSRKIETLMKETARNYAELLIQKGYSSYELIGYCMGGWLAIETARYLMEYGIDIKLVTTISTSLGSPIVDNELLLEAAFANVVGAKVDKEFGRLLQEAIGYILKNNGNTTITIAELCSLDGKFALLGKHFQDLSLVSKKERLDDIFKSISEPQEDIIKDNSRMLHIVYQLFEHNYRGTLAYKPEPYLGNVRALIVTDKSRHFFQPDNNSSEEELWENIVLGNLEIQYIEGNHQTCLEEPNVGAVMELLSCKRLENES